MDSDSKKLIVSQRNIARIAAELEAIRNSRSYRLSKKIAKIKHLAVSNPVTLAKKAAVLVAKQPGKLLKMSRTLNRSIFLEEAVNEQRTAYHDWILLNEPNEDDLNVQKLNCMQLKRQPLFSIVTPVFNPPPKILEELIESVLEQTYPNFELCFGNFGDNIEIETLLTAYAAIDPRIKHYRFKENKGIAGNSNSLLEKVNGEYIALLDHDDTLSPDALYENALMLNQADYDFIYSDKDKIDEAGNRFDPIFKAGVSPETLLNVNYLTHLNIIRASLLRKIGGWDSETDGAQDWDLFLRLLAVSKIIGHIPKMLYHWRVISSSTAFSIETKPYALAGQRRAIDKYLESQNIPATSYHDRTELFLRWDTKALDGSPLVIIDFTSPARTLYLASQIRKAVRSPKILAFINEVTDVGREYKILFNRQGIELIPYQSSSYADAVNKECLRNSSKNKPSTVLFMFDGIKLPKSKNWYADLSGWLSIKGVGAAGGRLVDNEDLIFSCGGVISQAGEYQPLFKGFPRYFPGYLGHSEWVRNLTILSRGFFATTTEQLNAYFSIADLKLSEEQFCDDYFLWLGQVEKLRLVMTPHVTASIQKAEIKNETRSLLALPNGKKLAIPYYDMFSNENVSQEDPMRLFEKERFYHQQSQDVQQIDRYQYEASVLTQSFDITAQQIEENRKNQGSQLPAAPKTAVWFLPSFDGIYAGLVNIFSFANYLATEKGVENTFYIIKSEVDVSQEKSHAVKAFPNLKVASFKATLSNTNIIREAYDLGFATQWTTTFLLAKADHVIRKCYFIQDNEINFYPKGSLSALAELSYGFGFYAVAGTEGLLANYKQQYSGKGVVLKSKVDLSAYHPRNDPYYVPQKPYRVFFYARPNMPRNAFELGLAGLSLLKNKYGNDIEVITAGAEWSEASYGLDGKFTNLGKIPYDQVPKLYRSVDVGLMFMFSGHPGVTASELMASGCPVVVNDYDDVTWHDLYKHNETCLITLATASEVARNIERCLTDMKLRQKLIGGGIMRASSFYAGYDQSLSMAYDHILKAR